MKTVKILSLLVLGPIIGGMGGFVVGLVLLRNDPLGRGAPGDGFLIILCVCSGLIVGLIVVISFLVLRAILASKLLN